jgi:hypothetical protein
LPFTYAVVTVVGGFADVVDVGVGVALGLVAVFGTVTCTGTGATTTAGAGETDFVVLGVVDPLGVAVAAAVGLAVDGGVDVAADFAVESFGDLDAVSLSKLAALAFADADADAEVDALPRPLSPAVVAKSWTLHPASEPAIARLDKATIVIRAPRMDIVPPASDRRSAPDPRAIPHPSALRRAESTANSLPATCRKPSRYLRERVQYLTQRGRLAQQGVAPLVFEQALEGCAELV